MIARLPIIWMEKSKKMYYYFSTFFQHVFNIHINILVHIFTSSMSPHRLLITFTLLFPYIPVQFSTDLYRILRET